MISESFKAQVVFQPTIGHFGLMTPTAMGNPQAPVVLVDLTDTGVEIHPEGSYAYWPNLGSDTGHYGYGEITRAETILVPRWLRLSFVDRAITKVGIRLDMGESRARVMIFSNQYEELRNSFEIRGVHVDGNPKKLNFLGLGKR